MESKKILFYYSKLNIGGAEKSLARLMNALANDGHEITLLTRFGNGNGEFLLDNRIKKYTLSAFAPKNIKVKILYYLQWMIVFIQRVINLLLLKINNHHYDLAIVGLQGLSPEIVCHYVTSDKCAICIRSDLQKIKEKERVFENLNKWRNKIDMYLCVSQTTKDSFDAVLPEEANKSIVIYNIINTDEMHKNALEATNPYPDDGRKHVVSVCRVSDTSKGVFRMLNVCEQLRRDGILFSWYLVGDGPDLLALKKEIKKRGLEEDFITVGKKENPFGYYRYADLVAVPSYYEGLCGVVNEAKVTGCAVIATEFSGIHEQLTHGQNGWIVKNNTQSIIDGMRLLLTDTELLQKLKNDDYPSDITDDKAKLQLLYKACDWK